MNNNQIVEHIIQNAAKAHINLTVDQLVSKSLERGEGKLTDMGALAADTGEFTGRSPKDKFTVCDAKTENSVWWGDINFKFTPENFDKLFNKVVEHYKGKELFVRDAYACANPKYRLNIKVVNETAYQNLFANNLFLRPTADELKTQQAEWLILAAPSFRANPAQDATRQHNFTIVNFTRKVILIGGSGYTGEIKKGIFSVLNYILPHEKKVLSMHCSANIGKDGDTAIFFGLSGTGKTTLSADPNRKLIGDDEHGWDSDTVFNFEGGCYAKCVGLTEEKEPQIWNAIKKGALVENVRFIPGTDKVNFDDISVTENTRVAYPIDFIDNIAVPSVGTSPKNIILLTADAFGVLPPISKLTPAQAMYHFISGYTAKVAGTEAGVTEPQATFSACFGKAFIPLHPGEYAELLGNKLKAHPEINVWLVNTGWSGGAYGTGQRMKLSFTRAMLTAALNGELNHVQYEAHPVFGVQMPTSCPNVPAEILNPRNTWADKAAYDSKANHLAQLFVKNFEQYASGVSAEILSAAPKAQGTV
ncbi:MAG: phosphoenolpyruvate carboxykinase (ATP) [Bacteroidia bacterium]|nr:phosphoenolpyruvate carboxykinase (ATP) [Bacteroidia bacterium]MCO5253274.1 phosphoenolpyruvate carboxykinase (ATP) [Bacteroidota bacterium]